MRSSNKSRSRNKNSSNMNRRGNTGNTGNIVNRVFDSAGPDGKVRGTPQQIIEKYQSLAHDAQMAGDRIGSENFSQHAEHYARLLGNAQREIAERRDAMEAQQKESIQPEPEQQQKPAKREAQRPSDQPDVSAVSGEELFPAAGQDDNNLVQTPENTEKKPAKKPAAPRKRKPKAAPAESEPASSEEPVIN